VQVDDAGNVHFEKLIDSIPDSMHDKGKQLTQNAYILVKQNGLFRYSFQHGQKVSLSKRRYIVREGILVAQVLENGRSSRESLKLDKNKLN
jgi:hypothetical protein